LGRTRALGIITISLTCIIACRRVTPLSMSGQSRASGRSKRMKANLNSSPSYHSIESKITLIYEQDLTRAACQARNPKFRISTSQRIARFKVSGERDLAKRIKRQQPVSSRNKTRALLQKTFSKEEQIIRKLLTNDSRRVQ